MTFIRLQQVCTQSHSMHSNTGVWATHLHMIVVGVLEAKVVLLNEVQRVEHLITEGLAQILFLK